MVDVRVTRLAGQVHHSGDVDASVRATRLQAEVVYADRSKAVRVTRLQAAAIFNDRTKPVRVTYLAVQALVSLAAAPPPEQPVRPSLPAKEREPNPYRATTPLGSKVDPEIATFMRTQQEHIREQHNVTQMGDATFPWEWLTKLSRTAAYTLGSLGRFYHDDFGIVLARYVKFVSMVDLDWINVPAGRLKSSDSLDWTVTNDFSLSGSNAVQGVIAAYKSPTDGDYGWLITVGANIVSLPYEGASVLPQDSELAWSATGAVAAAIPGQILARVLSGADERRLLPGSCFINLEGLTTASYLKAFAPRFDAQDAILEDFETRLALLEHLTGVDGLSAELEALEKQVDSNTAGLKAEIAQRTREIKALSDKIAGIPAGEVTQEQMNAALGALSTQLRRIIKVADDKGQQALDALAKINIDSIKQQLTALSALVAKLAGTIQGSTNYIPLVVGIPPVLVYDEDGQLILVEGPNG